MDPASGRAVIFDLDGTLADTFALITSSWNAAVAPLAGRLYTEADVMARFGPTEVQMIRRELPPAQQDQAIRIFLHRYREDHDNLATVFKGVRPMLRALSESGVKLGIMTGKGRDTANITLAKLRWTDLFDSVITGDEITRIKPDPQGVLMAAAKLGIEPQRCAYVGDAPADIGAGKAAGMQTIYAAWHPVYAEQVKNLHPDATAFVPGEILRVLNLR